MEKKLIYQIDQELFLNHANISKIVKKLNWKPRIKFENGVKELIKYIEDWSMLTLWNKKISKKPQKIGLNI